MRLSDLLRDADVLGGMIPGTPVAALGESVLGIALDSTKVQSGYLFVALPGRNTHGAMFANAAVLSGAVAVVTDTRGAEIIGASRVPVVVVDQPRQVVGQLSAVLYSNPAESMTMIGVTGTNGKTTVTHLVQAGLLEAGITCGLIGTLGASLPGHEVVAHPRTTPEAPELQQTLDWMRGQGAQSVAMEVSSIALRECRVDGITFDLAAFTGLTQDHLDYHGTMQAYFEAKADLFTPKRARRAVVVIDDPWGNSLAEGSSIPLATVSRVDRSATWFASRSISHVTVDGPQTVSVRMPIPTDFAMINLAVSVAVCHELGVSAEVAAHAAVKARIPGRMEVVASTHDIDFIVDYAHTPDAIHQVVSSAASTRHDVGGRAIVVLGAGGDRDAGKREEMGRAATSNRGVLIVTDDNPRSEDPSTIRAALVKGARDANCTVFEIASRREAIARAVHEAAPGDVVLVLGKGHETTQEIAGHVEPFDDRQILASFVQQRFGQDEESEQR